jgi:hypothetical protein
MTTPNSDQPTPEKKRRQAMVTPELSDAIEAVQNIPRLEYAAVATRGWGVAEHGGVKVYVMVAEQFDQAMLRLGQAHIDVLTGQKVKR